MAKMKQEYILQAIYEGKGELGQFQKDLKTIGKIESIKVLGKDIRELNVRFEESKRKLKAQAREMRDADKVTKAMSRSYEASRRVVSRLATALDKKKAAFSTSTAAARTAGVDTRNLAVEEKRLAAASEATGKVWAARKALGVRSHKDIRDEVKRLSRAYNDLKSSGKASALELFQAKQRLRNQTRALVDSTNGWAASLDKVRVGAVALAGVGYGVVKVFQEFASFESGMAEVYTLLDLSTEQFKSFKEESKGIMGDLPQESKDLTKSLYDIISAGVDFEKSNLVLEKSAKAAVAGVTDTNTAVTIGVGAMNAYSKEVDDLEGIYDILFQTVKSGVTTFPELSQSMGEVLPGARAAGVEFHEVSAAIAALTKAGIKTPQAATALKGAIRAMSAPAPEAKKMFADLGITWQGLLPTLEAIAEKSLSLDQMRLLIPDVEASTGVLSLTQNLDKFRDILHSMDEAGGSMEVAYKKMADTPDQQIKEMMKSVHDLAVGLGELSSVVILPLASGLEWLIDKVNNSNVVVKGMLSTIGAAVTVTAVWKLGLGSVVTSLAEMATNAQVAAASTGVYTSAMAAARSGLARLMVLMAANPVTAAITVAVLAAAAAWAIFGRDSLQASKNHAEAAKVIAEGRKAIDKEISSLEKLQDTFKNTNPASKEYLKAERELAGILPGANLSLDERGRLIVKVGEGYEENAGKLDNYLDKLKKESGTNLALQLEQQTKAYEKADNALKSYKGNMQWWYGIGDGESNIFQGLIRGINKITGTYDENIKKGEEVRTNLQEQKKAYNELLQSMKKAGVTSQDLAKSMDAAHLSAEIKDSVLQDYKKLEGALGGVADAADKAALDQEKSFRDSANAVKNEYAKLAGEVRAILDEIAGRQRSLTEDLRDMARSGMSDYGAWKDLKAEAEEYFDAAQNAAFAGDFEGAVKLADQARSKYKELNREVKQGGKVIVSAEKARETAMEGVKRSGELAIDTLHKQEDVVRSNAEELKEMVGSFSKGWAEAWDEFLADGKKSISELEKSLDKFIRDREINVGIKAVESKQLGGLVGKPQQLAAGGAVGYYNALNGLRLSGYGGGDRRWILGEDGEVMIRKESVKMAGARAALAFNNGRWDIVVSELVNRFGLNIGDVIRRQFGGLIDSVSAVTAPPLQLAMGGPVTASPGNTYNLSVHFSGNVSQHSRQDARNIARQVMSEFQKMHRGSS